MPLKRKEEKETVIYPASKRKAAPFKPPRPSKAVRTDSTTSDKAPSRIPGTSSRTIAIDDDDETNDDDKMLCNASDSDDDLMPDPRAAPRAKPPIPHKTTTSVRPLPAATKRKPTRDLTPLSASSQEEPTAGLRADSTSAAAPPPLPPGPSQSDEIPSIPQPLLVRLLHEHFADKSTKIDKHAIQVLQKYMEVFVRETIARTRRLKEEAVERGEARREDRGWLELEDLEKVAPGVILDF